MATELVIEMAARDKPRSDCEQEGAAMVLRELWAFALARSPTNIPFNASFFELGGNSLLAMKLVNAVNRKFFTVIPTAYFLEHNSINAFLANWGCFGRSLEAIPRLRSDNIVGAEPSFSQECFWHLNKREPFHMSSNLTDFFWILPDFNFSLFEAALRRVIRRHETLRTLIKENENKAVVLEVTTRFPEFQRIQLEENKELRMAQFREFDHKPFNLDEDLPIRGALFVRNGEMAILALGFHHVATDRWSRDIFLNEICAFYNKKPKEIPRLPIQFKDYAAFQRKQLSQPHPSIEFWKNYLLDFRPLKLPTDRLRQSSYLDDGMSVDFDLSAEVSRSLRVLARDWDTSLFTLLLSAYFLFLGQATDQTDLSVAVPVANRDHFQLEHVIGLFTNDIPLRQPLGHKATFQDFVRSVGGNVNTAKEHGGVPFSKVLFEAGIIADERISAEQWVPTYFQLVESSVQMSIPLESYEVGNEFRYGAMNYELTAWVDASTECIQVTLFGAHEVFDEKTLHGLKEVYEGILWRCPGVTSLTSLKDVSDANLAT